MVKAKTRVIRSSSRSWNGFIRTLTPPPGAVGGAKEIVNTLGRRAAADLSESTGIRFVEKGTGREIDLAAEGKDLLPPTNVAQMQGVQIVRDS